MKPILGRLDTIGGTLGDHIIGGLSKDPVRPLKAPQPVKPEVPEHDTVGDTSKPIGGPQ